MQLHAAGKLVNQTGRINAVGHCHSPWITLGQKAVTLSNVCMPVPQFELCYVKSGLYQGQLEDMLLQLHLRAPITDVYTSKTHQTSCWKANPSVAG